MKNVAFGLTLVSSILLFSSCQKEELNQDLAKAKQTLKVEDVTSHNGAPFSTNSQNSSSGRFSAGPGGGVMMQAFYWNTPEGGNWWNTVDGKLPAWSDAGIGALWLPPVSKGQSGALSMGYDPTDYFDLGNFNQNGTVETRFGSKSELQALVGTAHDENMEVYADIILNHNSGGAQEFNSYTNGNTWTDFTGVASGKFLRSKDHFHPNNIHSNDEGYFGGFPDLCHDQTYVQDWFWKSSESVAQYYKNDIGFDGWRFDFVKGFGPWVVKNWNAHTGGFSVGELWDGNVDYLNWWANEANSSVFDFACYYKMNDAFDGNNLSILYDDMMWKRNPMKAVTFVTNHDTDEIWNKMLAYSYILTHEGYPTIFYRDYEEWLDKERLNNLIWIHNNKATGTTSILYADNDEYLARRNGYSGNPGLIVYINNSDWWVERWVPTNWYNAQIKDYTGHSGWQPTTQGGGWVKIQCPPKSYSVWSTN